MKMTIIKNMTPHSIRILTKDSSQFIDFPPSGEIWRLDEQEGEKHTLIYSNLADLIEFKIVEKTFNPSQPVPEQVVGIYYIVSALFKQSYPKRFDFIVPDTGTTAVRDFEGKIEYVTRFNA